MTYPCLEKLSKKIFKIGPQNRYIQKKISSKIEQNTHNKFNNCKFPPLRFATNDIKSIYLIGMVITPQKIRIIA